MPSHAQPQLPASAPRTTPNTLDCAKYWQWAGDQLRSKGVPESEIAAFISHKSGQQRQGRLPAATIEDTTAAVASPLVPVPAALTDEEWFRRCNHLAQQAAAAGDKDDDIVAALLQSYLAVTPTTAPAVVSERAILAKEIVFGARLLHAVAGSSQSSDFTFAHTAVGTWPPERLPTLSRWYRVAAMAKAYPAHCAQLAPLPTLLSRAQAIARECGEVLDNKVSLWLYGGPGHVVYHLIDTLSRRHGWSIAQVDARLEVTLVNLDTTVHNYNKWSIPCAKVLRGSLCDFIGNCRLNQLPHVMALDFSPENRAHGRDGWESLMQSVATICRRVHNQKPDVRIILNFPTDAHGRKGMLSTIEQTFPNRRLGRSELDTETNIAVYLPA